MRQNCPNFLVYKNKARSQTRIQHGCVNASAERTVLDASHLRNSSKPTMITLRPAHERGHADHGWLNSYHTFSFADYYDPNHMGFRALRVINDDRVAGGKGFPTHSHRDMEIVSYVLEGGLSHRDSMGTGSQIFPNDVQRMSAGTGVSHSEFNTSASDEVHFLQIWLLPKQRGLKPGYEQKTYTREEKRGRLRIIASPDGRDGSVTVASDSILYAGLFRDGERDVLALGKGRHAWVHVAAGRVKINGHILGAGDGAAFSEEASVVVESSDGGEEGEVLVFDLG
jgi:redox-sensitive bicupin YhaK (pirin superfamily)